MLLIVSLIKPGFLNKIIRRQVSRKQSVLSLGIVMATLFILFGASLPPVENKEEVKGENVQVSPSRSIESTPTPDQSPTPEPSPTPTPIPTQKPFPSPVIKPSPAKTVQPNQQTNSGCDPSYPDVCIPPGAADYDCEGGSGNGPNYIDGPIQVLPPDPHDLDRDGDGIGCES